MAGKKNVCRSCGTALKRRGKEKNTVGDDANVCIGCLDGIFPERGDLPVVTDSDGNVYFLDGPRRKVYIFFRYGDVPYASCTEVDIDEEFADMGCGDCFLMVR